MSTSQRARFSTPFKIASLLAVVLWFAPSVCVWPRDVCKDCAEQVVLVTSLLVVVVLAIAVALLIHAL